MNSRSMPRRHPESPPPELAELIRRSLLVPPEAGRAWRDIEPVATRPLGMTFEELLGRDDPGE